MVHTHTFLCASAEDKKEWMAAFAKCPLKNAAFIQSRFG
jgi:hypothetical protein